MLKLLDSSVDLLRNKHKNGEVYYWLIYYTFLSPQQLRNVEEIIEKLRPHIRDISFGHITGEGRKRLKRSVQSYGDILLRTVWRFRSVFPDFKNSQGKMPALKMDTTEFDIYTEINYIYRHRC